MTHPSHPDLSLFAEEVDRFLSNRLPRRTGARSGSSGVMEVHGLERRAAADAESAVAAAALDVLAERVLGLRRDPRPHLS